jgi:hypothetical protein
MRMLGEGVQVGARALPGAHLLRLAGGAGREGRHDFSADRIQLIPPPALILLLVLLLSDIRIWGFGHSQSLATS